MNFGVRRDVHARSTIIRLWRESSALFVSFVAFVKWQFRKVLMPARARMDGTCSDIPESTGPGTLEFIGESSVGE